MCPQWVSLRGVLTVIYRLNADTPQVRRSTAGGSIESSSLTEGSPPWSGPLTSPSRQSARVCVVRWFRSGGAELNRRFADSSHLGLRIQWLAGACPIRVS